MQISRISAVRSELPHSGLRSVLSAFAFLVAFFAAGLSANALDIVSGPDDLTVVAGKKASFTVVLAEPGTAPKYQWRFNGEAIPGDAAKRAVFTVTAQPARDGNYDVVVTNREGATATSRTARLTVWTPPRVTTPPASVTLDAGAPLNLSVVATGVPAPTFQWFLGDTAIEGATGATYAVAEASVYDAGKYTVRVSNAAGTVPSKPASVVVRSIPVLVLAPGPTEVAAGVRARLDALALGFPAPKYQWRFNGKAISGARSPAYVFTPTLASAGSYEVVVTNSLGSATSDPFPLVVTAGPKIVQGPAAARLRVGDSHVLSVVASGFPAPSFQWTKDGKDIPDAVLSSLTISPARISDTGLYAVRVINAKGSVPTKPVQVDVSLAPYTAIPNAAFRLNGSWTDIDGDGGYVNEVYTLLKDGRLGYRDLDDNSRISLTYKSFKWVSPTTVTFRGETKIDGVAFVIDFRFEFTTATTGTYSLRGKASSVGYIVYQSGGFVYSQP